MNSANLKSGDTLIAKNPCIMEDDKVPALTVGKQYTVTKVYSSIKEFTVTDDQEYSHYFDFSELNNFFNAPTG